MNLYGLAILAVIIVAMKASSMEDDVVEVPPIVQYQLLSIHSGKFIGVTGDGCIHGMGDIRG